MSLQGKIESIPLTDLYQWIQAMHKTGSLSLNYGGTEKVIFFRLGSIAGANSPTTGLVFTEDEIKWVIDESLCCIEGTFRFIEASLPGEVAGTQHNITMQSPYNQFDQRTGHLSDRASQTEASVTSVATSPTAQKLRAAVFERVFKDDYKIPLLPTVAQKVLEITRRENFSLRDLGNAILTDQVIAARVLKLANSGAYGGQNTIDSLPVAVQRLGSQAVANLVLVLSLQSARNGKDIFLPLRQQLWQHASACALFARII
ncbi:MAG TPA: HDOD domain-containing protein, partial [Blastocatellia bacterium]|nr:HDOD domain-containing protein [Blastocatellia bacterium]